MVMRDLCSGETGLPGGGSPVSHWRPPAAAGGQFASESPPYRAAAPQQGRRSEPVGPLRLARSSVGAAVPWAGPRRCRGGGRGGARHRTA